MHPVTLGAIRCPTPGIAVADGKWEMRGVTDAAGVVVAPVEGQVTLVLSGGSEWLVDRGGPLHTEAGGGAVADVVETPGLSGRGAMIRTARTRWTRRVHAS